jgi:hypothetical protein
VEIGVPFIAVLEKIPIFTLVVTRFRKDTACSNALSFIQLVPVNNECDEQEHEK